MPARIQITKPTHMIIDGQPSIVLPGSVVDVPDAAKFLGDNCKVLAESAASVTKPTSVRSVKLR